MTNSNHIVFCDSVRDGDFEFPKGESVKFGSEITGYPVVRPVLISHNFSVCRVGLTEK